MEALRCKLNELLSAKQAAEHILALKEREIVGHWSAVGVLRPVDEIVYRARSVAYGDVDAITESPSEVDVPRQRWEPPPGGTWKVNVDGAFWEQEKKGAWGFAVRDDQGHAALAGSGSLEVVNDALSAESHACIAALQAAADHGLHNIILETDSTILVKALQTDAYDRARDGMLFREAKYIMAMNFSSVVVAYAPRSCNSLAHDLAQFGRNRDPDDPTVWEHPLPDFVNDLVVRGRTEPLVE
ncbi:hypothetical protein C2845_PM05G12440 [Panicum miliaceum]|uniref:RNase H type-1 domain-containing protein n=1 Tax=Panicum miliaceum TaxID=4540 RepID=A0A3L6T2X5_PANMI|nr:hypothetical protein C2845_PM05G12440 [Panicum miliaceum]